VWQRPVEQATKVLSRLASIVHPATAVSPAG
jgi:hypothetical protein